MPLLNVKNVGFTGLVGKITSSGFFTSLYESFKPLTSVINQHFVEWFSGADISTIWTKTNTIAAFTYAMADEIDGGYKITSPSTSDHESGRIWFNTIDQFSATASICIFVSKHTDSTTNAAMEIGFYNSGDVDGAYLISRYGTDTYFSLATVQSGQTVTASDVPLDTNWHCFKVENGSSNNKLYIDGVLKCTATTNRPTGAMTPRIQLRKFTSTGTRAIQIRYFEAYNTTVSISSSLYERLSALTQVMNQRVVEWFGGSAIDSTRWTFADGIGTGSGVIDDTVDGGYKITSGTVDPAYSYIAFNDKRQYDHQNSVLIQISKRASGANTWSLGGLGNGTNPFGANTKAYYRNYFGDSFYQCGTRDGTTDTQTNSTVATDTSWHIHKLELSASNCKYYIDGVLEVTKTTNLPTAKLQPTFSARREDTTAGIAHIRYCEVYNKLTTLTDYPSVYEMFQALTSIMKTRFVDWFSGSVINPKWTNMVGAGSASPDDSIDGGIKLSSGAGAGDQTGYGFNNKRQYNHNGCVVIAVWKANEATNNLTGVGLSESSVTGSLLDCAMMDYYTGRTNFALVRNDGVTSTTTTEGSVARDQNWHSWKMVLSGSDIKTYIDGVLDVTVSTDLPNAKMQPCFNIYNDGVASVKSMNIRYLEAYNT